MSTVNCVQRSGLRLATGQEIFSSLHPSRPVLGPTQLTVQWVSGLFHGGKAVGAWR